MCCEAIFHTAPVPYPIFLTEIPFDCSVKKPESNVFPVLGADSKEFSGRKDMIWYWSSCNLNSQHVF